MEDLMLLAMDIVKDHNSFLSYEKQVYLVDLLSGSVEPKRAFH